MTPAEGMNPVSNLEWGWSRFHPPEVDLHLYEAVRRNTLNPCMYPVYEVAFDFDL
jgi:hypothetical protein